MNTAHTVRNGLDEMTTTSFSKDPFRDESKIEDEWFEEDKPTWKPPARHSSRPPRQIENEEEMNDWFV